MILKAGNKERTYSSSITKTPAARYTLEGIEDMIPTLWSPVIIAYDKDVEKRSGYGYLKEIVVRRADQKLYKFKEVRKILRERLLNFKFGYNKAMPLREWTEKDKRHTGIIVNKIDDLLLKRRILRSLEVMVGGRKTETDKRLLQRTV
ncbi:hypothetical protein Tco_1276547 [Tanacetum coccineum]